MSERIESHWQAAQRRRDRAKSLRVWASRSGNAKVNEPMIQIVEKWVTLTRHDALVWTPIDKNLWYIGEIGGEHAKIYRNDLNHADPILDVIGNDDSVWLEGPLVNALFEAVSRQHLRRTPIDPKLLAKAKKYSEKYRGLED